MNTIKFVLMNYIKTFLFILITFSTASAFGQKIQTKEIKITYTNGIKVFDVCISNPSISFDEKKEYNWYSDISGSSEIKKTEGGCGGNLLHGKERFFNNNGNLLYEHSFNLGLLDGESKYWDSTNGKLQEIYRYANGYSTYRKMKIEGGWLEDDVSLFLKEGYTKRYYDEINNLTTESIYKNGNYFTKDYYKYSNKIKAQYSTPFWCDTCMEGKYVSFYQNGNKKVEGQFSDSLSNTKIGIWKWYTETGSFNGQETYKEEIQRWSNGEWKITGGYYFDKDSKKWLKIGKWDYSDEEGKLLYSKVFDFDIEVEQ